MTRVLHVQKVKGISGSEAHLLSLLPRLRARGFDATMLVLHEREPGATEFVERMRAAGVPTEAWHLRFDLDPTVPARLLRRHPDILHTHLVHADLLALPAGAAARVPLRVSTKHGFNEFRSNGLVARADRAAARFAHRQIAISAGLADYLATTEGFDRASFTVVHYGIDPGQPPPALPTEPRLLAVGRLIPIKGLDVLLRAFADARREVPELTLELAGAGPLEAELRATASEGVTFLGRVSPVGPVYERNAIVVVPSRGEGFGMVALEAAERGRAAIVSGVGGLPEVVEDGVTGLVVPPEDAHALAQAIVELARDPDRVRAFGVAARQRALTSFSAEAEADAVADLYRTALQTRSAAAAARSTTRKSNGTR
jgi:glycosyltransferase involved in cell wall biosynthesis